MKFSICYKSFLLVLLLQLSGTDMFLASDKIMDKSSFRVQASIDSTTELKLQLVNLSNNSLTFYTGLLSRSSINLILVEDSPYGKRLDEQYPLGMPPPGAIEVGIGETYSESINLDSIFPTLESSLKKKNVVLYWSATIETVANDIIQEHVGGYILIKRQTNK